MLNLFEILQKAQGGHAADALAQQFGLSPSQAQSAIDALLPAFTLAFQNIAKDPQSWPAMMAMMTGGTANPFIPAGLQPDPVKAFFGQGDLSERIAAQAAAVSGVNTQILQQMMPVMAHALAGGFAQDYLAKNLSSGNMAGLFSKGSAMPTSFPGIPENWGELMAQFMNAGLPSQPKPAKPGDAPLNPFDPASYGVFMQRMLDASTGKAAEPEGPPPEPPPTASDLGLDAVSQWVETGRTVQEQHAQALQQLFSSVFAEKTKS